MIPFPALPALFADGVLFFFHSITLPHYIIESISLQIKITFYFFIRIYLSKITFFLQNRCFLQIHIFIYMFFDY